MTELKNEIVKINPAEYGIEVKKANELEGNLPQIISERNELEKQFDNVIKKDIEDLETTKQAKELRLLIQKNRTQGINVWHKNTKDFFLKGGQFVDAIKRKEIAVNERMENDLMEIEKYAEIKEQKRLKELQNKRVEILSKYVEDATERNLATMEDDVWNAYLSTKKKEFEDKIEAEKKAEKERIAKEKAEAEERERIKKENEQLKAEAEAKEKQLQKEAKERADAEAKKQAELDKEKKEREEEAKKQREEFEAKLKKEREEKERIEKEAKIKREKLEAEIKEKNEKEAKERAEAEAKKQAELQKGDAEKINDLINDLNILKTKYSFTSAKFIKLYNDTKILIDKTVEHLNK